MSEKKKGKYVSKGERRSVATHVERTETQKTFDKQRARLEGRNVYFTIDNPNPLETNKRKIRVNGKILYQTKKGAK